MASGCFVGSRAKEPKPAPMIEKFNEAKWMNGMGISELSKKWKFEGSQALTSPSRIEGTMAVAVEKYKTDKEEDVLVYYIYRYTKNGVTPAEMIAVQIFSSPEDKYAIYHSKGCKWEEVEFFEISLGVIPHSQPWISIIYSYKPKTAK